MASGKTLFFLCLLLVLPVGQALAEYKGFFLFDNLQHGVTLDYLYTGQRSMPKNGSRSSSSSNRFSETYNAGIEYSILDPYILNGHLKVSLGLDQQSYSGATYAASSSSSSSKYSYDLDGTFLKISPTPVHFSTRSESRHVEPLFTPGYDLSVNSSMIGASFQHKILELRLDYQDSISETSGLANDTKVSNRQLSLKANHAYKNSATEMNILHNTGNIEPVHTSSAIATDDVKYVIIGKNVLTSSQRDKTLNTSVTYSEEAKTQAALPEVNKNLSLGESFNWQLGKALTFGANYENSSASSTGMAGFAATDSTQQIASVTLNHTLYKSLNSRLKLQGRQNDLSTGRETEQTGTATFLYTKKLAPADSLSLSYTEEYSVTDRNLTSGILTVLAESLTAQIPGNNLLQQPNVITSGIIVRDQANPLIAYVLNRDYRIIQTGAFTGFDFSLIGSGITNGQILLVSYQVTVDEKIKYRRSFHNGSATITFDEGVNQLYANVAQASQEIISGQADIMRTDSSLNLSLGATHNKNSNYANIVYVYTKSNQIDTQHVEGTMRITRYFEASTLNAQVKDRYAWYGSTGYTSRAYTENLFSLSCDYSRNLFSNGLLTLRTLFYRNDTDYLSKTELALESSYRWGFGKFFLEALGRVQFRDTGGDQAMDDRLSIRITRTF